MKKLLLFLTVFVLSLGYFQYANAWPHGYPTQEVYQTQVDLDTAEADIDAIELQVDDTAVADAIKVAKVIRLTYSATADGGGGGGGGLTKTFYDTGIDLPAGAIVTRVWGQIAAEFASADSNTISVIATDLLTADAGLILQTATTQLESGDAGDLFSGTSDGLYATATYSANALSLYFVTGTGTSGITGGSETVNIEYEMGTAGL